MPSDSETWIDAGRCLSRSRTSTTMRSTPMTMRRKGAIPTHRPKRDWTLFYATRHGGRQKPASLGTRRKPTSIPALKLSPDQPELLNYLGYSWVDQGRRNSRKPWRCWKRPAPCGPMRRLYRGQRRLGLLPAGPPMTMRRGRCRRRSCWVPGDSTINDHLGDALSEGRAQDGCPLPVEPRFDLQRGC